jgi:signal transduction histidine kinase
MLFDKKSRKKNKTMGHKTDSVILVVIVITFIFTLLVTLMADKGLTPISIVGSTIVIFAYTYIVTKLASRFLCYKFVDQVNRMTDVAKEISSSSDLSKRVHQSNRGDELRSLELELNFMLDQLEYSFEKQRRFVSDASHELRTPLSILKGYLDILNEWGMEDQDLFKESIDAMLEETNHMKGLIVNLLFLARSDHEQVPLMRRKIDLKTLVHRLVKNMSLIAEHKKIKVFIQSEIAYDGDQALIVQMLRAIVNNSLAYTGEDGEITIEVKQGELGVEIIISDNGIGIEADNLKYVFERFYRGENARGYSNRGSGLGLAMAKEIVDLHGGSIEVDSQVSQGTQVRIILFSKETLRFNKE